MSLFVPFHSVSKIGKNMGALKKLAHFGKQLVFSIKTLCNY